MPGPLTFEQEFSEIQGDSDRHERFVDLFGQFVMWLRNLSLRSSRKLVETEALREELGTIRRRYYDGVAAMPAEGREAALLLLEETFNGFIERLTWSLGDQGTDARLGSRHAYRFRIEMEIVEVETNEVVHTETINRGGRFFGKYWGRWLNRFRDM